ncbi:MAG: hypothetical protein V7785_21455 [Bermanella sp.]
MAKILIGFFALALISGCANKIVEPEYGQITYDYLVPSPYPLSNEHKNIFVKLDGENLAAPTQPLNMETLKLKWVNQETKAQVVLYLRVSSSFLIERPAKYRKETILEGPDKGGLKYVSLLRGFIRTHYQIELVDIINDQLIDHFQGAHHYPIETIDLFDHSLNVNILKGQFDEQEPVARKELMATLWLNIQNQYLQSVQVSFGKEKFYLVKSHKAEPRFLQAFNLLNRNTRTNASQALNIYNRSIKDYKKLDDDTSKALAGYIDYGITVSSRISNHAHQDRYPGGQIKKNNSPSLK